MTESLYKEIAMGPKTIEQLEKRRIPTCLWASVDGSHETGCGEIFLSLDEIPLVENSFKFCIFCGKQIEESGDEELIVSRQMPNEADLPRCLECSWTSGRDGRPVLYKACDKCRPQEEINE